MPAQNLPGTSGPYRIDVNPQNPTFYALADLPKPHTSAANSPFTLIGDTSTAAIEVRQGWPFAAPKEDPDEIVEGDIIETL
jgi:hypothetical protein